MRPRPISNPAGGFRGLDRAGLHPLPVAGALLRQLLPESVQIIDPAIGVARQLDAVLGPPARSRRSKAVFLESCRFCVTADPDGFAVRATPGWASGLPSAFSCCRTERGTTRIAAPRGVMSTVTELLQPVETDLETLLGDLRSLIGAGHPILQAAAEHLFSAGGKRCAPALFCFCRGPCPLRESSRPATAAWLRSLK